MLGTAKSAAAVFPRTMPALCKENSWTQSLPSPGPFLSLWLGRHPSHAAAGSVFMGRRRSPRRLGERWGGRCGGEGGFHRSPSRCPGLKTGLLARNCSRRSSPSHPRLAAGTDPSGQWGPYWEFPPRQPGRRLRSEVRRAYSQVKRPTFGSRPAVPTPTWPSPVPLQRACLPAYLSQRRVSDAAPRRASLSAASSSAGRPHRLRLRLRLRLSPCSVSPEEEEGRDGSCCSPGGPRFAP